MPKTATTPATAAAKVTPHCVDYLNKFPILDDGVHLGLPNDRYHADPALGSTNIRSLLKGANQYWWDSWMNPKKPKNKTTPSKILGSAVHALLLDGKQVFDAGYVRGPYNSDSDLTPPEKSALTKEAKKKLLQNQELLTADEYDFCLGVKDIIDCDPELEGCLDNGLSEVSVFWTRGDGVRCKARFDKLKLKGIGDIKTIANERGRDLEMACKLDISTYRYDIPADLYLEGRREMVKLVTVGKVYGDGSAADLKFLDKVAAQPTAAFQIVFIPKTGAPDAWSCTLSPGNPILLAARADIEAAISYYRVAHEMYGTERWLPNRGVSELDINEMPYNFGRTSPRK